MIRVFLFLSLLVLSGCGIESSLPGETPNQTPDVQSGDDVVNVASLSYSPSGVDVVCNINPILLSPDIPITVFTEFDGQEVERMTLTEETQFSFNTFDPPYNGRICCVVEYGGAEFESSGSIIDRDLMF